VKIGKLTISWGKQKGRVTEKFRAGYDARGGSGKSKRKVYSAGENTWTSRCRHYNNLWKEYALFRQAVTSLAGLVNPQGVYFKPAVNKKDESYALAEEALYRCEQFRDNRFVNGKIYETAWYLGKYGSCFWELGEDPFDFRVPTLQEYIEPWKADAQGNIVAWRQIVNGAEKATWTDDLVLLSWNVTYETWPYGNGLAVGLETEMSALVDMETSSKDYMEKSAWPYEILQVGNGQYTPSDADYESARTNWSNRKPGEGLVTDMPSQIIAGGTNSAPIRELAALCGLMKDNIHDGFIVPPLSKLYNATEASAKELRAHVMMVIGHPVQWLIAENMQEYVLKPLLERSGFSRRSCPTMVFEDSSALKKDEAEVWLGLVQAGIQSPEQACKHLRLDWDEEYAKEKQRLEQEQLLAGKAFPPKNAGNSQKGQDNRSLGVKSQ